MDKRLILAVAGSGKTTYIINQLDVEKRYLIVTYTRENTKNLRQAIQKRFGYFPDNITLYSFFEFLYSFCFIPFRKRIDKPRGIFWDMPLQFTLKMQQTNPLHFFSKDGRVYHNRLSKYLINKDLLKRVNERVNKYFDSFFIDEIQDFGGYDFELLMSLTQTSMNLIWVGDYYQHTYDTSRDANKNKRLYSSIESFTKRFVDNGIRIDNSTLNKSYRFSETIASFIKNNLEIQVDTFKKEETIITILRKPEDVDAIIRDNNIVKLFYQNHRKYTCFSGNWGSVKGINHFKDVCVVLNKTSYSLYKKGQLFNSNSLTKNKLYVAFSRANRNLYIVSEELLKNYRLI